MEIIGVIIENKYHSIKESVKRMYDDRLEEVLNHTAANDSRYKEIHEEVISTQHALRDTLGEEQKKLYLAMDAVEAKIDAYSLDKVYEQAFKDGFEFARMMGGLERG